VWWGVGQGLVWVQLGRREQIPPWGHQWQARRVLPPGWGDHLQGLGGLLGPGQAHLKGLWGLPVPEQALQRVGQPCVAVSELWQVAQRRVWRCWLGTGME